MSFRFKRHRRGEDHGVEDWLMTYADMITLLLCFFAIFLSISTPKKDLVERAKEQMVKQFANPNTIPSIVQSNNPSLATPESKSPFSALPSIVDHFNLASDVEVHVGDRLTTIEMNSAPFFASGSSDLSREGQDLLAALVQGIRPDDLRGYKINVEGHTDDIPVHTLQFPSNWELSTGRAATVVRFFIEHGLPANKLRASGYADTFPKFPNRNVLGQAIPDNQARNRRVVIRLEKIDKNGEE